VNLVLNLWDGGNFFFGLSIELLLVVVGWLVGERERVVVVVERFLFGGG
jgi:hypothetical protein